MGNSRDWAKTIDELRKDISTLTEDCKGASRIVSIAFKDGKLTTQYANCASCDVTSRSDITMPEPQDGKNTGLQIESISVTGNGDDYQTLSQKTSSSASGASSIIIFGGIYRHGKKGTAGKDTHPAGKSDSDYANATTIYADNGNTKKSLSQAVATASATGFSASATAASFGLTGVNISLTVADTNITGIWNALAVASGQKIGYDNENVASGSKFAVSALGFFGLISVIASFVMKRHASTNSKAVAMTKAFALLNKG